ncbi:MAG: dephospho-CoA kinase [Fibromonadales bacterium]|nr:dephospho-CoA kinase [Fibromonadales bacterium]
MLAITGLIGSGKSLVASVVREAGFEVLDADSLAHKLYRENADLRKKIAEEFGAEAIDESGVNRPYISQIVFNDEQKLCLLESIVHPILQREIEKINPPFVEAAVLYKWQDFAKKMQEIWIVQADENIRKERLLKKGMSESDIERRMKMQGVASGEWLVGKIVKIVNNSSKEVCIDFTKCLIEKIQHL